MAEYGYDANQTLQPGQAAILQDIRPCRRCPQLVLHDNLTPNLRMRGIGANRNCCNPKVQYSVSFTGNIAVPEDGTVGPIIVALALDGEPILTSRAIVTPAAVDEYFNVTSTAIITVPKGCCFTVAVENTSEGATAAEPATAINVQNENMTVTRIA